MTDADEETKILRQPFDLEKVVLNGHLAEMSSATNFSQFEEARIRAIKSINHYDSEGVIVGAYFEIYNNLCAKRGYLNQEEVDVMLKDLNLK